MAAKGQMTGMLGTYLAAAELTNKGFIVSITSRNARGSDLFATDQNYKKAYSIQVKTNRKAAGFWLINSDFRRIVARTHVYIFINLRGDQRPDYYVVPSRVVAKHGWRSKSSTGSVWYALNRRWTIPYREKWSLLGPTQSN
jgi:hypothetical protein